MGAYINPPNEEKEDFLVREGDRLTSIPKWEDIPEGRMLVTLIHNGLFTAAGISFDEGEYKAFTRQDSRPKLHFLVDIDKLMGVSDLKHYYERLE